MEPIVKRSLYRLASDLVKADKVIAVDELDFLDRIIKDCEIEESDILSGYRMTLGVALENLAGLSGKRKETVVQKMIEGTTIDGVCSREESLLIEATKSVLASKSAHVISVPAAGMPLKGSQVLYVEDYHHSSANAFLSKEESFEELSNMMRLGGFDLIYIPKVALHYASYQGKRDLGRVISLVSPAHSALQVDATITALQHMTTPYFYRNILKDRLQMPLEIKNPVWMMRITDNVVDGEDYANFLCMEVEKDIRGQLKDFVAGVNSRINEYAIIANSRHDSARDFLYSGFYKTMLDVMAVKKINRWELRIRTYGDGTEMFKDAVSGKKTALTIWKDGEEYPVFASGRDVAFFALLLCASSTDRGGVDFNDMRLYSKIQDSYESLYQMVSRRATDVPDVTAPQTRIPMKSRVIAAIRESRLTEQSLYMPQEKERGMLYVPIEADRVKVVTNHGIEPLMDSDLFASARF